MDAEQPLEPRNELVVANFNIHAGVDGWGTPFDVTGAVRAINADVLVLCEAWASSDRSLAASIATTLGYELHEVEFTPARIFQHQRTRSSADGWGPYLGRPRSQQSFSAVRDNLDRSSSEANVERGFWRLAVLSRVPVTTKEVVDLPHLFHEPAARKALLLTVSIGDEPAVIAATHLGHLLHGSMLQMATLRRHLHHQSAPVILVGDMNCWGPLLVTQFPGWHRAVRGRTWPAWRPHSQLDHILLRGDLEAVSAEVLGDRGSDHLPIRSVIRRIAKEHA